MAHHHHPPPGGGGWRPPYGGPAPPSGGGPFGAHNAHPAPGAAPYGGPPPSFADIHRTPSYPEQPHASVDAIIPACPTTFPQIQNMSVEELRVHLGDPVAFDRLIREHPHCQVIERELSKVREQVKELQARNVSRQADLARMTGGGSGKSLEAQLAEERAKLEVVQRKFDDWLSRNSRDQLAIRLDESAQDAQRASEELTERFKAGDMTYEAYMKEYSEVRRQFHERTIKLNRFKNLHDASRRV